MASDSQMMLTQILCIIFGGLIYNLIEALYFFHAFRFCRGIQSSRQSYKFSNQVRQMGDAEECTPGFLVARAAREKTTQVS